MQRIILNILIILSINISAVYASHQPTQTIRGRVTDADTKIPLVGVSLVIAGTDPLVGIITDNDGAFKFEKLHVGRYDINVFYLGYEPKTINAVLLGSGKEVILNIELTESLIRLEEVTVIAGRNKGDALNTMATVSARSFTVEETKRYAGGFHDPARMAVSYAGVAADPGGNNDIIIRGNSPRGLLWRLEGVEIPNPNHFSEEGATGGPISILNSTTMDKSDFYTAAFPAEYGNAYSGVFDINLRKGNNEQREYTLQAGIIGFEGSAEGPLVQGQQASYLLNYRYSSLAMLNTIGIKIAGDAVPEFQDLTFNIHVPTRRAGSFSLFGLGGMSKIIEDYSDWHNDFATDMGVSGIKHLFLLGDNTYINSTLAVTGSRNVWSYSELNESDAFQLWGREDFNYTSYKAQTSLNHKINSRHYLKAGVIYSHMGFNVFTDHFNEEEGRMIAEVDEDGQTAMVQTYTGWRFRATENLSFNSGFHHTYLKLNGNYSIEPRIGMKWQFHPRQSFSAGIGVHSKVETLTNYFARVYSEDGSFSRPNKELELAKARHYVLAYEYMLTKDLKLKTELYYQDLYRIPVEADTLSSFSALNHSYGIATQRLSNKGTGTNYGTEITLEKFFTNNYYFLVTGSLYESRYTGSDGVERDTRYNGNYIFNVLAGKEFALGKEIIPRTIGISLRSIIAGGQRYTPVNLESSILEGYTVRDSDKAYSEKREDFIRFDFKAHYRVERNRSSHVIELDIQNVINRLNIMGDYFDSETQSVETYTQMGIIPVLSYRIEF